MAKAEANAEQLALLKQGSELWNEWRKENPDVEINLASAYLFLPDLSGANLHSANLISANFGNANLFFANLRSANLIFSNLNSAGLVSANLSISNLSGARLSRAILHNADLSGANLITADFCNAELNNANLSDTDLIKADLRNANLRDTNLSGANLRNANLSGANLYASQVLHANFTGATLTGACIADWQIGSSTVLEKVECDYFFRAISSNGGFINRCPPNRNFEPGEFTKLVQIHENTVELIFRKGINWSAFAHAFNETNTKIVDASGQELYLKKYEVLDNGLIRLEVTVPPGSDREHVIRWQEN